jgi:hypothetical protein
VPAVVIDGHQVASVRRAVSSGGIVGLDALVSSGTGGASLPPAMVVEALECSVRICTWNLCGSPPPTTSADLASFGELLRCPHDFLVVGFQELSLSAESLVFNAVRQAAAWKSAVETALKPALAGGDEAQQLVLIGESLLVGMYLLVYVRRHLLGDVTDVVSSYIGSGLLGKMGNKGGVGVRLQLGLKTLAFVNCHLAAHQHEVKRRNADYAIIDAQLFPQHGAVASHDVAFFFGDLNYRLEGLTRAEVVAAIDHGRFEALLARDQLINEHRAQRVLAGYFEPKVRFAPTYRYGIGTNVYDLDRVPAYTDRILFRTDATASLAHVAELPPSLAPPAAADADAGAGARHLTRDTPLASSQSPGNIVSEALATNDAVVVCVRYETTPSFVSDHKPVVGEFVVRGERRAPPVRAREFHRRADAEENAMRPHCSVAPVLVDFQQCMPLMRAGQAVTVTNHGAFDANISVAILDAPWVDVQPRDTVIKANSSRQLQVFVCLPVPQNFDVDDGAVVAPLSHDFNTVLVVRTRGGGDHFVSIAAHYASNARVAALLGIAMARLTRSAPARQSDIAVLLRSLPPDARAGAIAALLTAAGSDSHEDATETASQTTKAVQAEGADSDDEEHAVAATAPDVLRALGSEPHDSDLS